VSIDEARAERKRVLGEVGGSRTGIAAERGGRGRAKVVSIGTSAGLVGAENG
jgi:hypothetical protein